MADWTPELLSGKRLWLDALDDTTVTLTSGKVSIWADKSDYENIATQGTADLRPIVSAGAIGGNKAFIFSDGIRLVLSTAIARNVTNGAFFCVFRRDSTTWNFAPIYYNDGYIINTPFDWYAGEIFTSFGQGSGVKTSSYFNSTGNFIAVSTKSGSSFSIRMDGTALATTSYSPSGSQDYDTIGSYPTSYGILSASYIGEILLLDACPSEDDIKKVEGYLAWKWGIEDNLPETHPYYSVAPTDAPTPVFGLGDIEDGPHEISSEGENDLTSYGISSFNSTEEIYSEGENLAVVGIISPPIEMVNGSGSSLATFMIGTLAKPSRVHGIGTSTAVIGVVNQPIAEISSAGTSAISGITNVISAPETIKCRGASAQIGIAVVQDNQKIVSIGINSIVGSGIIRTRQKIISIGTTIAFSAIGKMLIRCQPAKITSYGTFANIGIGQVISVKDSISGAAFPIIFGAGIFETRSIIYGIAKIQPHEILAFPTYIPVGIVITSAPTFTPLKFNR